MARDLRMVNYIESGFRAEIEKQKAIANNVANMNTPGYRRYKVQFEELFAKALENGQKHQAEKMAGETIQPKNSPVNEFGNDVSLELEVTDMVKNSLKHKALMNLLKKKYQQFDAAINIR